MKSLRLCGLTALGCAALLSVNAAFAQIVINEVVREEQSATGGAIATDVREFVELYNAGNTPVNIGGWSVGVYDILSGSDSLAYLIPDGTTIGPDDYFVVGGAVVPNVDFTPGAGTNLFADGVASAILLRDGSSTLVDGVGYDIYRTGATGLSVADPTVIAQLGKGYHGRIVSLNSLAPISPASLSRYRDGRDTNHNGYDFGFLPVTPGASNDPLFVEQHSVPNVDSLAVGTALGGATEYNASFTLPKVINPMVASSINPRALPTNSPQGGNAIIAWDETGGGNAVYSRELTNSFDIYAYFDTAPLGVAVETNDEEWESTAYGIGSTDPYFNHPDPSGGIFIPSFTTQNGSTGIGWVYQNYEDGTNVQPGFTKLMLVDFGEGGENKPPSNNWTVIETIDMTTVASDWYRLGMEYDPETGEVTAWFDDQTFMFTTETDLLGNFFVGYREAITGAVSLRLDKHSPPTFDLYVSAPPNVLGDYDDDGDVDNNDYTTWKNAFGSAVTAGSGADGNSDGIVNAADYTVWRDNLGASGSGGAAIGAVPEPGTALLAALALGAILTRRRSN